MNKLPTVLPSDEHNAKLVANVHPPDWANPEPAARYNVVVIGAGAAGLVTAAGAAGLGAKVALVERHLLGGDCLNVGCVPSKCVIRSARVFGDIAVAPELGVNVPAGTNADFGAVMERMRKLRARISHVDSAPRFRDLGVDVFLGEGRFTSAEMVEVAGKTLRFKKAVIATGGRPAAPPITGLAEAGYLTNETVFELTELPRRLAVIGGGPIGCELAQTFQRLGAEVTLLHRSAHILSREDVDAARIVQDAFVRDGMNLVLNARITKVERDSTSKVIHFEHDGEMQSVAVDEIIVSTGRAPNVESLNLEVAGVAYDKKRGVHVNDRLQTSNPNIYAAGDICMKYKFTHAADAAARIVIQNALFFGRKKVSALTIPWCTYTAPEVAHVGLCECDAADEGVEVDVFKIDFADLDRAITDGEEDGFVKVLTRKGTDEIVGATIVARHAGEMISEVTLAMTANIGLTKLATVIHPYPTQAEAIRKAADAYNRTRLTPTVKRIFEKWFSWTR